MTAEAWAPTAPAQTRHRWRLPTRLRNLELLLLVFACAINGAAILLVQLGALGHVDFALLYYCAALAALVFLLHVCLRVSAPHADPLILPIVTVLNGLGIAEIYRIDLELGQSGWQSAGVRQIAWTAIAVACAIAVILVVRHHRMLQGYTYLFGIGAIVLLLLPMVPGLGRTVFGARIWIAVGPFSFQPGEVAKLFLAVFFAGYLVQHRDALSLVGRTVLGVRLPRLRDMGPILVLWALSMAVIVFQRDLGTALLYFGLFLVMLYVATGRVSWVAIGVVLFAGGALVASRTLPYVTARFQNWLDPFNPHVYDATRGSFQLVQGLFGMAYGGILGTGLGQGRPATVPLAQSDYIIASLGEELGLAGLFAILALYLLFVSRGFRIGFSGRDDFGKLLAVGLAFTVALQCFIVIGGITRVIPLTGLATPFLAAGGSSLTANWIIAALLLRLSDTVHDQPRVVV
ncbi:MAG TPA: FtsW/RodA/SpoVE family cell cycle protein [Microbacteriaceae bacterium]|nr:FtsW/RodA/SpoVE family cell cycle protein [Microbacteriaceae bacterium]